MVQVGGMGQGCRDPAGMSVISGGCKNDWCAFSFLLGDSREASRQEGEFLPRWSEVSRQGQVFEEAEDLCGVE